MLLFWRVLLFILSLPNFSMKDISFVFRVRNIFEKFLKKIDLFRPFSKNCFRRSVFRSCHIVFLRDVLQCGRGGLSREIFSERMGCTRNHAPLLSRPGVFNFLKETLRQNSTGSSSHQSCSNPRIRVHVLSEPFPSPLCERHRHRYVHEEMEFANLNVQ